MKKFDNMRVYAWIEFVIWLIIVAITVLGIRYHHYKSQQQYKSYQIFMEDVDGLIVGSPVKFLGVQIGYVKKIQIVSSSIYIKFVITQKGLFLPVGAIATVEASGLGGSKALEIYPPPEGQAVDKIVATKDPTTESPERFGSAKYKLYLTFLLSICTIKAFRKYDLPLPVCPQIIE